MGPPINEPITLWLSVWVNNESWFKSAMKGLIPEKWSGNDIDNKINSICDLLKLAGVIHDDCQVLTVVAQKHFGKMEGNDQGAEIIITRWEPMVWG